MILVLCYTYHRMHLISGIVSFCLCLSIGHTPWIHLQLECDIKFIFYDDVSPFTCKCCSKFDIKDQTSRSLGTKCWDRLSCISWWKVDWFTWSQCQNNLSQFYTYHRKHMFLWITQKWRTDHHFSVLLGIPIVLQVSYCMILKIRCCPWLFYPFVDGSLIEIQQFLQTYCPY